MSAATQKRGFKFEAKVIEPGRLYRVKTASGDIDVIAKSSFDAILHVMNLCLGDTLQ